MAIYHFPIHENNCFLKVFFKVPVPKQKNWILNLTIQKCFPIVNRFIDISHSKFITTYISKWVSECASNKRVEWEWHNGNMHEYSGCLQQMKEWTAWPLCWLVFSVSLPGYYASCFVSPDVQLFFPLNTQHVFHLVFLNEISIKGHYTPQTEKV